MPPKLGIIAGGGGLPPLLVRHCQERGRAYYVIRLKGQTDPADFQDIPGAEVRLGAAGETVKLLHRNGVEELIFAGAVRKPPLAALWPDLWTVGFLVRTHAYRLGDDGLLSAIIAYLESNEGFRVVGVADVLDDLLAPLGVMTEVRPDDNDKADIRTGLAAARDLGRRDIGQAVIAGGGQIVATEDRAGTDAMLASLKGTANGGVLVKAVKPGQERRADLPSVGPATITLAAAAGLKGIAVEAGGALIIERDEMLRGADAAGLFVIGVAADGDAAP